MARSIWTGAISFGLVTVPVKLYSAVNRKTVRFNQLHESTGARIQMQRVDPTTGEEVPYDEIVKGYEIAPDRYVTITNEELEALDPKKTRTIEIEEFANLADIDPIFYDHPYYLAPGPGGAKPYRLLLEAMAETGKVAIARVVIRSKENLVAVRPMDDVLGMTTMIFPDEVVDPHTIDDIPDPDDVEVTDRELAIAKQLVESLAGTFEPEKYHDTYRDEVLAVIERKAAGEEIAVQPPSEDVTAPVPDLMSALKASLDAVRKDGGGGEDGDGAATKGNGSDSRPKAKSSSGSKKSSSPRGGSGSRAKAKK